MLLKSKIELIMARRKITKYTGGERRNINRRMFWAVASCNEVSIDWNNTTSGHSNNEFFASTVNISDEGMLLESFEKVKPGSLLSIRIANTEDDSMQYKFIGRVMHNEKLVQSGLHGLGIKFVQKPKHMEKLLH